jgi:hypothetical protein
MTLARVRQCSESLTNGGVIVEVTFEPKASGNPSEV